MQASIPSVFPICPRPSSWSKKSFSDGGNVIAEKVMTVTGGSWRVVEMDVTLEAGEHTITLGDQVGTVTVTE